MAGRRRIHDDAVEVHAVRVGPRERDDLRESHELVDAGRHRVEDVREIRDADPIVGAAAAFSDAMQRRREAVARALEEMEGAGLE